MSDVQPTIDDEIDLFELVEILWSDKVIIGWFLAVALVVGGSWIAISKKTYETVTEFEIITLPPSESGAEVVADLRNGFPFEGYLFPMVGNDAERQTPIGRCGADCSDQ